MFISIIPSILLPTLVWPSPWDAIQYCILFLDAVTSDSSWVILFLLVRFENHFISQVAGIFKNILTCGIKILVLVVDGTVQAFVKSILLQFMCTTTAGSRA
jgi:hypothetical protein